LGEKGGRGMGLWGAGKHRRGNMALMEEGGIRKRTELLRKWE